MTDSTAEKTSVLLRKVGLIADSPDERSDVEPMLGFPTRSVKFNGGITVCPRIDEFRGQNRAKSVCGRARMCLVACPAGRFSHATDRHDARPTCHPQRDGMICGKNFRTRTGRRITPITQLKRGCTVELAIHRLETASKASSRDLKYRNVESNLVVRRIFSPSLEALHIANCPFFS